MSCSSWALRPWSRPTRSTPAAVTYNQVIVKYLRGVLWPCNSSLTLPETSIIQNTEQLASPPLSFSFLFNTAKIRKNNITKLLWSAGVWAFQESSTEQALPTTDTAQPHCGENLRPEHQSFSKVSELKSHQDRLWKHRLLAPTLRDVIR